jgi:hypothetical protein
MPKSWVSASPSPLSQPNRRWWRGFGQVLLVGRRTRLQSRARMKVVVHQCPVVVAMVMVSANITYTHFYANPFETENYHNFPHSDWFLSPNYFFASPDTAWDWFRRSTHVKVNGGNIDKRSMLPLMIEMRWVRCPSLFHAAAINAKRSQAHRSFDDPVHERG